MWKLNLKTIEAHDAPLVIGEKIVHFLKKREQILTSFKQRQLYGKRNEKKLIKKIIN